MQTLYSKIIALFNTTICWVQIFVMIVNVQACIVQRVKMVETFVGVL